MLDSIILFLEKTRPHHIAVNLTGYPPPNVHSKLNVGNVLFTSAGIQLLALCTPKSVDGYCEYVLMEWGKQKFAITLTGQAP